MTELVQKYLECWHTANGPDIKLKIHTMDTLWRQMSEEEQEQVEMEVVRDDLLNHGGRKEYD